MTTREEAAAKALFQHDNRHAPSLTLENAQDHLRNDYLAGQTVALAAADAHDAAHGIHRLELTDATVERAARAAYDLNPIPIYDEELESFTGHKPWEWLTPRLQDRYRDEVRAVLAAAVEADHE